MADEEEKKFGDDLKVNRRSKRRQSKFDRYFIKNAREAEEDRAQRDRAIKELEVQTKLLLSDRSHG